MAADRALAEQDQAAGDDVGALDRDADRHRAIEAAEVVERAFLHRLAAVDVHGVVDRRRACRSVACDFMIAVTTAGFWPWSMAAQVSRRAASSR